MIDSITGIANIPLLTPVKNLPENTVPADTGSVEQAIRRAKAMMSLQKKTNPQATNLLLMAETALKNGNPASANNFAQKVLKMVFPDTRDTLLPGTDIPGTEKKKEPDIPDESRRGKTTVADKKKHTEHMYQDASNDTGVSFSYPGRLTGPQSFIAVPAHEREHVGRSISDAVLNGEQVLTFVSYRMRFDPATGEPFLSGGTTTTIRRPRMFPGNGQHINMYA